MPKHIQEQNNCGGNARAVEGELDPDVLRILWYKSDNSEYNFVSLVELLSIAKCYDMNSGLLVK